MSSFFILRISTTLNEFTFYPLHFYSLFLCIICINGLRVKRRQEYKLEAQMVTKSVHRDGEIERGRERENEREGERDH